MAIFQALLTALLRQAGRLLNTVLSWATGMLFGKVPEKRQIFLSLIAGGSVIWIVLLVGIVFPAVGAFLLAFIPLPDWLNPNWVRLAMLILAVALPALLGFVSLYLSEPEQRPQGSDRFRAILKGYPSTLGLALTILMLLVLTPILKLRDVIRRWTTTHVPIVVEAPKYFEVLRDIQHALARGGVSTLRRRADWMLRTPTRVFTFFAGSSFDALVAQELTVLQGEGLEVLLHPSDLVIRGEEAQATRAHALLSEHLTFTSAYLTWSKEAHQIEDRLAKLWHRVQEAGQELDTEQALAELRGIENDLRSLQVSTEEWSVLLREKLQVERALLRKATGLSATQGSDTEQRLDDSSIGAMHGASARSQ